MDYTPPQDHFKHRRLYTHGRIPQGGSSDCSFICFNVAFLKRVTEYFEHPPHLFLKSHLLLPQCRVLNSAREPLLHYIDYPIPVHPHLLLTHPITTLQLHIFLKWTFWSWNFPALKFLWLPTTIIKCLKLTFPTGLANQYLTYLQFIC